MASPSTQPLLVTAPGIGGTGTHNGTGVATGGDGGDSSLANTGGAGGTGGNDGTIC
ncbi:hypothetical protein [Mycobacterium basiliense]|uniref:hypothetical protein n=1 Tax=Mycobacterium basiliense TaxID=2094119 RepID=UPI001E39A5CA|nr:hypothetical protein [Mycobacterium basiliense]